MTQKGNKIGAGQARDWYGAGQSHDGSGSNTPRCLTPRSLTARSLHVTPRDIECLAPLDRPDLAPPSFKSVVREAVREELLIFFGPIGRDGPDRTGGPGPKSHGASEPVDNDMRQQEMQQQQQRQQQQEQQLQQQQQQQQQPPQQEQHRESPKQEQSDTDAFRLETTHYHFSKFVHFTSSENAGNWSADADRPATDLSEPAWERASVEEVISRTKQLSITKQIGQRVQDLWELKEPERAGVFARMVRSPLFESTIRVVVLVNCGFMLFASNWQVRNPHAEPHPTLQAFDIFFLSFYTCELVLKLFVHRLYFFWNADAGMNTFDFLLVVAAFADVLATASFGSVALRSARILKLGKALRALRVISQFNQLRAILVCIYGSFIMLFFSVVMLCIVFFMFSLIFVQQVAGYFQGFPVDHDPWSSDDPVIQSLTSMFGSVQVSMLTLWMAVFGGDDWSVPYYAIGTCGWTASAVFLVFIAFAQIALINIITGVFVDAAMLNLAPDNEQKSLQKHKEEAAMALELERLCIEVDDDRSGKLTREQFRHGIRRGRIPMLLQMLGLDREHVKAFFDFLCDAAPDHQVDIRSFVKGCMRLKGAATSFDLQLMRVDIKEVRELQEKEFVSMHERLRSLEGAVQHPASSARPGLYFLPAAPATGGLRIP